MREVYVVSGLLDCDFAIGLEGKPLSTFFGKGGSGVSAIVLECIEEFVFAERQDAGFLRHLAVYMRRPKRIVKNGLAGVTKGLDFSSIAT